MKKRSRFAKPSSQGDVKCEADEEDIDYLADLDRLISRTNEFGSSGDSKRKRISSPPSEAAPRSLASLMQDTAKVGLSTALSANNKGFQLMEKLGYKVGTGLGKDKTGIVEPITLLSRNPKDAAGLGIHEARHKSQEKLQAVLALRESIATAFQAHNVTKFNRAKLLRDIRKASKVLYELDLRVNDFSHPVSWQIHHETEAKLLLPGSSISEDLQHSRDSAVEERASVDPLPAYLDDTADSDDLAFVLGDLLLHLRDTHCYCFYCGVQFGDQTDLCVSCPGISEEDH